MKRVIYVSTLKGTEKQRDIFVGGEGGGGGGEDG